MDKYKETLSQARDGLQSFLEEEIDLLYTCFNDEILKSAKSGLSCAKVKIKTSNISKKRAILISKEKLSNAGFTVSMTKKEGEDEESSTFFIVISGWV